MRGMPVMLLAVLTALLHVAGCATTTDRLFDTKEPKRGEDAFWLCIQCGTEIADAPQYEPRECSDCGGEAVWLIKYYCVVHDHVFDGYLTKYEPESYARWKAEMEKHRAEVGGLPAVPPPRVVFKVTLSDEWTEKFPRDFCCPFGNCDRKTLKYYMPQ